VRRNLLYAGTELGMYLSFDGGDHWRPWQLNLPVVPVTDLQVHGNDLVAATQGRAFWILTDLSPVRQFADSFPAEPAHLYQPADAIRVSGGGGGFGGNAPRLGQNPPAGALIYYSLKSALDSTADGLTLEILDSQGAVVRKYTSKRPPGPAGPGAEAGGEGGPGGPPRAQPLPVKEGLNRFVWDLRYERPTVVPGLFSFGAVIGRRVVPGTYQARLTLNGQAQTQTFHVLKDPRVDATPADFQAQDQFVAMVARDLSDIHAGVTRLRNVRDQVNELLTRLSAADAGGAVEAVRAAAPDTVQRAGKALVERLNALEDSLVQKRTVDGQTVINFPVRLNHHFIYLMDSAEGAEGVVTDGAKQRYSDLSAQWTRLRGALDQLLGPDLAGFNALVRDGGVGVIVAPK
jgi:hypothetical protein